jgi:tetratricopeptide (TPR) repeat protein
MQGDEAYFNSEEFQELLNSYEASMAAGEQPFMDADDLVDIADFYNQNGEKDKALDVIEYALQLYPNTTLPNVFMAREALMNNDFKTAREYASQIAEHDDPDYHYLQAEIMIAEGHIKEADRYLRNYGRKVDADEYQDFIKDCANLYIDYGINDKAYEWMMRSKGDNSSDFKELMARTLFGLGKFKDSERLFNELIDTDPYSAKYWKALAGVQLMNQDYSNAVTSSEYAIAIDPEDPESIMSKASALMYLENYEEAEKYYRRYVKMEPDDEAGLYHLAVSLIYQGKNAEAKDYLLQAEAICEKDSPALLHIYQELAFCYSSLKEVQKALETLDKTLPLTDDKENVQVIKGHILLANDDLAGAEKAWKKALSTSVPSPGIILRILVSLYDNHYVQQCYVMLKEFCRIYNKDREYATQGYSYLALCCHDLGYKDEFLKYMQTAIERNPQEAKSVLGFLFPPDTEVNDYYEYMTHQLNQ